MAGALNWTGIADSHGVPVGNYYLSVVSTSEAITKAGPGVSVDPTSWAPWLADAFTTGLTHDGIAQLLQAEATNLASGVAYWMIGGLFALFILYAAYSYVMICCAAFLNALLAIVAAGPAMIHGTPRKRAFWRLQLFFKHAYLVFAYITYTSVAAVIVLKTATRGGYADQVGTTHPLARLVMIGIFSGLAIGGL